ncbi:acidic leucine-rich nuclear phosphoprotein 32 family member B-like [Helianthus annuus]|uniref:acidic leucine-rich nuclear phosphoprotein 32 family member B-like n=1 Tax=Helianthus annuus TaxID=4232 RepID=UPI000B90052E|nr:acidic leucine-rich nuclear phosphoprotein 32 family member B-like [Helianthus annuus]
MDYFCNVMIFFVQTKIGNRNVDHHHTLIPHATGKAPLVHSPPRHVEIRATRRARLAQTGASSSLAIPAARAEAPAAVHLTPGHIRIQFLEADLQDALRRIRDLEEADRRRDFRVEVTEENLHEMFWRVHFLDQRVPPSPPAEPEMEEEEPERGPEEEPEEVPEEDPEEEEPDEVADEGDDDDDGDDGDDGVDGDADMGDGEVDD